MRPDVGAAEDAAAIRVATVADAAAIAAIYAPYVTDTPISFEEVPPDAAEIARRMTSDPVLPWLVAPVDHGAGGRDRIVGYAYASRHRPRAAYRWAVDCTAYVTADHQRAGLGRRLYAALFDELRNLGYTNVFAGITLPNAASVGLHEACSASASWGFTAGSATRAAAGTTSAGGSCHYSHLQRIRRIDHQCRIRRNDSRTQRKCRNDSRRRPNLGHGNRVDGGN